MDNNINDEPNISDAGGGGSNSGGGGGSSSSGGGGGGSSSSGSVGSGVAVADILFKINEFRTMQQKALKQLIKKPYFIKYREQLKENQIHLIEVPDGEVRYLTVALTKEEVKRKTQIAMARSFSRSTMTIRTMNNNDGLGTLIFIENDLRNIDKNDDDDDKPNDFIAVPSTDSISRGIKKLKKWKIDKHGRYVPTKRDRIKIFIQHKIKKFAQPYQRKIYINFADAQNQQYADFLSMYHKFVFELKSI